MTFELKNQAITLDKLTVSDINARGMGKLKHIDNLAEQISEHGLIQPLTVFKVGALYQVDAGRRRFAAIKLLAGRGDWPGAVPCRIIPGDADDEERRALSFVENAGQLPMHPLDRMRVIAAFVKRGMSPEQVAGKFAMELKDVQKLMQLQRLALPIRAAFAKGEISEDKAFAFASSTDQEAQLLAFKGYSHATSRVIRQRLKTGGKSQINEAMKEGHRFFEALGFEEYEAAGGGYQGDLFTDEGERGVDGALVISLLTAKLKTQVAARKQETGAAWSYISLYDRPTIDAQHWDQEGEVPMQTGVVGWVNWRGDICTRTRLVRTADFEAWETLQRAEAEDETEMPEATTIAEIVEDEPEAVDPESLPKPPSQPMLNDAARALNDALRAAISEDFGFAFDLMLARLLDEARRALTPNEFLKRVPYIDEHPALETALQSALPDNGGREMTGAQIVFGLDATCKQSLFAAMVAGMTDCKALDWMQKSAPEPKPGAISTAQRLSVSMHDEWSDDDRRGYLDRMTKHDLCQHVLAMTEAETATAMKEDKPALVEKAMGIVWLPDYFTGADSLLDVQHLLAAE